MNGGQNFTYQWLRDGNTFSRAAKDRYMATQAGIYTVIAPKNAVSNTSDATLINIIPISVTLNGLSVSGTQQAVETIVSQQTVATVYRAGNSILLNPNFIAEKGAVFRTELGGCN